MTGRFPFDALLGRQAGPTRFDGDFVGDDEAGIKADAELADQCRIFLLVTRELGKEFLGTGLCNGAEMINRFLLRQPDAVVSNADGARVLVEIDLYFQLTVILEQGRIVEALYNVKATGHVARIRSLVGLDEG